MVLAGFYGLWHLTWSLLPLLDFVLSLDVLQVTYAVAPFNALEAVGLIVVTSAVGYLLGHVLAWLWNRFGAAHGEPLR